MKLVEKGDFDVKIEFTNRDEIGQLAKTFNNMTKRINKLINEVYVDKVKTKELELSFASNNEKRDHEKIVHSPLQPPFHRQRFRR